MNKSSKNNDSIKISNLLKKTKKDSISKKELSKLDVINLNVNNSNPKIKSNENYIPSEEDIIAAEIESKNRKSTAKPRPPLNNK